MGVVWVIIEQMRREKQRGRRRSGEVEEYKRRGQEAGGNN